MSEQKHQAMAQRAEFLGVAHDLSQLPATGEVVFWPARHIITKLRAMMAGSKKKGTCTPAEASKFRCVYGFAATAEFGQLGKAPMRPFKQRQYWDVAPWALSDTMRRAMGLVETLLEVQPARRVKVIPDARPALVVASDAQVEQGDWPGGGALVHDPEGPRVARYLQFKEPCLSAW